MIFNKVRAYILDKQKDFNQWSFIWSTSTSTYFPCFAILCNYYLYFACAIFADIIICVLFVGRGQFISCDNFLSNPIAVLFAMK
jgi:hypothetical protein